MAGKGQMESPHHLPGRQTSTHTPPSHTPAAALLHPQGTQSQHRLCVSCRKKLWWGPPHQSHFPDRHVGGGRGAHRGTICPGCSGNLHPL